MVYLYKPSHAPTIFTTNVPILSNLMSQCMTQFTDAVSMNSVMSQTFQHHQIVHTAASRPSRHLLSRKIFPPLPSLVVLGPKLILIPRFPATSGGFLPLNRSGRLLWIAVRISRSPGELLPLIVVPAASPIRCIEDPQHLAFATVESHTDRD